MEKSLGAWRLCKSLWSPGHFLSGTWVLCSLQVISYQEPSSVVSRSLPIREGHRSLWSPGHFLSGKRAFRGASRVLEGNDILVCREQRPGLSCASSPVVLSRHHFQIGAFFTVKTPRVVMWPSKVSSERLLPGKSQTCHSNVTVRKGRGRQIVLEDFSCHGYWDTASHVLSLRPSAGMSWSQDVAFRYLF